MEKIFESQSRVIKTDINDKLLSKEEMMKKTYNSGPWPEYNEKAKEDKNNK